MKPSRIAIFALALAMLALGLSVSISRLRHGRLDLPGRIEGIEETEGADLPGEAEPEPVPTRFDILTGLPVFGDEEAMHLAVVVENAPAARPQTGLHEAALVYEVPVEGGITRFLAIYSRAPSGPVGPVRSLRSYLMDLAEAHDVPLVFCGGSPDSLAMVKQKSYPAINELNGGTGFYRDSARKMPHNLYTSPEALYRRIARAGFDTATARTGFVFQQGLRVGSAGTWGESGSSAQGLSSRMGVGYTVSWTYAPGSGMYERSVNGAPDIDSSGDHRIVARNVVVMFVSSRVVDSEGRLELGLVGSGRALVASGGSVREARWKRSAGQPVRLVGDDGADIPLLAGITWVHVVSQSTRVDVTE